MFVHVHVAIISENVALECQSSEANTRCRHSKSNSHSNAEEPSGADDNHTLTPDTITKGSSTQFWSMETTSPHVGVRTCRTGVPIYRTDLVDCMHSAG